MNIYTLLFYIVASLGLELFLLKLEKKKKDHFIDYVVISNIYMIVLAGIFSNCYFINNNDMIFLIILFQILEDIFYKNIVREMSFFQNNDYQIKKYISSFLSTYFVNILFIYQIDSVFLNIEEIKFLLWVVIIIYFYFFMKNDIIAFIPRNRKEKFYQDKEYIVMQYAKFKSRYGSVVYSRYRELIPLIYAMMIYENYYRPEFIRKMDHFKYQAFKTSGKFGIMQVYSHQELTDEESIQIAIKRIEGIYFKVSRNKRNSWNRISKVIFQYHRKDAKEILNIDREIRNFIKK